MTNETELLSRIDRVIQEYTKASDDGYILGARDAAQAIIDDLGLEIVSGGGRPGWRLQIVGKWEKQ